MEKEIIKNTLADIEDEGAFEYYEIQNDGKQVKSEIDFSRVIESISTPLWGKLYLRITENDILDEVWGLKDYINKMPHGIVDKKRPGIGATTLEIESKRNSIIVMPTKVLAYNKSVKHPYSLYVGSKIKGARKSVSKSEILNYLKDDKYEFKKILVVADSLYKVIEAIGKEVFQNYFLMIDEVDMLQSDSNFRPALEDVFDYYFLFNVKNRCLLTATMNEFSNPELKYECKFDLTDFTNKRKIILLHTNNISSLVKEEIVHLQDEKILIAYNSITQILAIIKSLDKEQQNECSILCSEASEVEAGKYYRTLTPENTLPSRITFMTCSYFVGVDIEESYHLITVSDARKFFQVLSIDKMTQIAGRCRVGLLSERIIFNTPKVKARIDTGNYQEMLLNQAEMIIKLYKASDDIVKDDESLIGLFEILKKAIEDKATYTVLGESIKLTRKSIFGEYVPAYLNIDSLVEKLKLDSGFYINPKCLLEALKRDTTIIHFEPKMFKEDKEQELVLEQIKEGQKVLLDDAIGKIIEIIESLEEQGELTIEILTKERRNGKRNTQVFLDRFIQLYEYVEVRHLLRLLWDIRAQNHKAFKTINNAVIYWALEDKHPFKISIEKAFEIDKQYTGKEINFTLTPILEYHVHKQIKHNTSINLLSAFFLLDRPRTFYKIKDSNPLSFEKHKKRIPIEENLIKYLIL